MTREEAKYKLYRATNTINGKVYIGYTCNFATRKSGHKHSAKAGLRRTKFYSAIRKYGWDAFYWEIIFESWDKEACLMAEKSMISDYNSVLLGYNIHEGGRVGASHFGEANGMFGKTHTDEVKIKLSSLATERFKGKSYEDLYGVEKANALRKSRSEIFRPSTHGSANSNFDHALYEFVHFDGRKVLSTRFDMQQRYGCRNEGLWAILNGKQKNHRGWSFTSSSSTPT
jgi:group I intron endonuclease